MERISEWIANGNEQWICGITTGLVKNNWDKEHPGMIQAEYFLGTTGKNVTGWIPVAVPYAFRECGMYLLPEIGAEVVIAFHMGDRNCPVVLGCLWNKKNVLPKDTAAEGNKVKRFKTKGGCEITFLEEEGKEAVEVHTPAQLTFRMEDEGQTISIADKEGENGILVQAGEGNLKLFAAQKMTLEIGGKAMISLDGNGGSVAVKGDSITEEAAKTYSMKGQSVKLEGAQMEIEGKSQLSAQSSGMVQVTGAAVKLN